MVTLTKLSKEQWMCNKWLNIPCTQELPKHQEQQVPRENIIMPVFLFRGTSGFLRVSVLLRWVDDTWNVGAWRHQSVVIQQCPPASLKLSSVSTSPPIKACFSAVTKHLSAHKLLPVWLLLVWFVVSNIANVVGHPHLQISRSFDSTSCTDTHVWDIFT